MLELACSMLDYETPLAKLINSGLDVHEATAQIASEQGVPITRAQAKTSNFLSIYGGGNQKLADGLKCSLEQATQIRQAIFKAAPEMKILMQSASSTAELRGWIFNWLGRRCHFPDPRFAYRSPNYLVSGGCADIVKIAMNRIDDLLKDYKSKMVITVHDELVFYLHETETEIIPPKIKEIMESSYKSKYIPLLTSGYIAEKNWGEIRGI